MELCKNARVTYIQNRRHGNERMSGGFPSVDCTVPLLTSATAERSRRVGVYIHVTPPRGGTCIHQDDWGHGRAAPRVLVVHLG